MKPKPRVKPLDFSTDAVDAFNAKIHNSFYRMESATCLCGATVHRRITDVDDYGLFFPVVICRRCGLIYATPRMRAEDYDAFYQSDEYRRIYESADFLKTATARYTPETGSHILSSLVPFLDAQGGRTVLEFGCGGGWNLIPFVDAGYRCTGYEYSTTLVDMGRRKGFDLHPGGIGDVRGEYDIIILNHVLEHFCDPLGAVQQLQAHLRPGGLMYIAVPNMDIFALEQIQNAHVYYFTPRTFVFYLSSCKLDPLWLGPSERIHMAGVFRIATAMASDPACLQGEFRRMYLKWRLAQVAAVAKPLIERAGIAAATRRAYHAAVRRAPSPFRR